MHTYQSPYAHSQLPVARKKIKNQSYILYHSTQLKVNSNNLFSTSLGATAISTPRISFQDVFNNGRSRWQIFFFFPSFFSLDLAACMFAVVLFFSNRGRVLCGCAVFQVGEFVTFGVGDVPTEMYRMHHHESCSQLVELRWFRKKAYPAL